MPMWEASEAKPRRSYGNLMDHIRSDHPKYLEELRESNRSPFLLGNISVKAHNIYGWLHWVITDVYPFSFVDKRDTTQQFSRLKSTCAKTLVSYMSKGTTAVEPKITNSLPSQFGIMVDGWSDGQKCQRPLTTLVCMQCTPTMVSAFQLC